MRNRTVGLLDASAFVLAITASMSAFAAPIYTNAWNNTEGVGVVKNMNDAANWTVTYGEDTSDPVSSVPTKDSLAKIQKSASVTLQSGDALEFGPTYFLASGEANLRLNVTIPTGASLSLLGTDYDSWMGNSSYYSGSVNTHAFIDVNGGSLYFGQKTFRLHGNTGNYNSGIPPENYVTVRNGGSFTIANGVVMLYGGENGQSTGKGSASGTNVIEVLKGSTLTIKDGGHILFGSADNLVSPQAYQGGGWLNVKGGEVKAESTAAERVLRMMTHQDAYHGSYISVSDGGRIDLGGRGIFDYALGKSSIRALSGGMLTNFFLNCEHPQSGDEWAAKVDSLIEADGGTIWGESLAFGTSWGKNGLRSTFRVHGPNSRISFNSQSAHTPYHNPESAPYFVDLRLTAHTPRTADFPVNPLWMRMQARDGAYVHFVWGVWRVSPDGGFQIVHSRSVDGYVRRSDDWGVRYGDAYAGVIGEEMWKPEIVRDSGERFERYIGETNAQSFRLTLKDEAKLTDGVALADGVPRAWLPLPKFRKWQVAPISNDTEYVAVRLNLVPQASTLENCIAGMRANGHPTACVDESVSGYNVRIDLPVDELAAGETEDAVVMDFVSVENYAQAKGLASATTNALVTAATCDINRVPPGMLLLFR